MNKEKFVAKCLLKQQSEDGENGLEKHLARIINC